MSSTFPRRKTIPKIRLRRMREGIKLREIAAVLGLTEATLSVNERAPEIAPDGRISQIEGAIDRIVAQRSLQGAA
jgi:transcriptional regulator with XRE-family HTH domain